MLKEKGTKLYTFRPKSERGFKVVLRNMHHSTDQEEIKKELNEKGHKVLNITNIIQRSTKKPLPLFFIELQASDNNKDIYNINKLMNCIVIFEAPHHKRTISQCTKCQKYGHTKNYCTRDPVCVKCAGRHLTIECKNQIKEVKCALCGGKHTANYKGCEIYKALKMQRFPPLRNKETTLNTNKNNTPITTAVTNIIPGVSYADVASSSREHKAEQELIKRSEELKDMVKSLVNQMTNMMNIITMLLKNMNGQK